MIDLSYKPRKKDIEQEPPMIVQMIVLAPFALGLAWIILQGLCR